MLDGDTIFALGTGVSDKAANVMLLGVLAAEATALAVQRAILAARAIEGYPAAVDFIGRPCCAGMRVRSEVRGRTRRGHSRGENP